MATTCKIVWDEYGSHTKDTLSEAWHSRRHTDITIVAENRLIPCHKIVLANNISYFREILSHDFIDDKPLIVAVRAPFELINAILTFTYLGEANVVKHNLTPLMRLAEELGVNGLIVTPELNQNQYTQSDSVLYAAEALQSLGKANYPKFDYNQQSNPINYQTVPKHPNSEVDNQPSAGEQPPQEDQEDFQNLRYKAAASREVSQCSSPTATKRRRLSQTSSLGDSLSPDEHNYSPSTSGSSYPIIKQEDPDSEDSDGGLQIDEGVEDQSPMRYCDVQMYVEDAEPQDLKVESRQQQLSGPNSIVATSPVSNLLIPVSSVFLPTSSATVFPSTPSSGMIQSSMASNGQQTASKKRPNSFGVNILNNANTCANSGSLSPLNGPVRKKSSAQSKEGLNSTNVNKSLSVNNSNEKSYSLDQLTAAVEAVIKGEAQPVEVISQYCIPRRTFFRHLKIRRNELGIETKVRSKPSSRATSPSQSLSSSVVQAGVATSHLASTYHHNPVSLTLPHAMLKSICSANSKATVAQQIKQESDNSLAEEGATDEGEGDVFGMARETIEEHGSDSSSDDQTRIRIPSVE